MSRERVCRYSDSLIIARGYDLSSSFVLLLATHIDPSPELTAVIHGLDQLYESVQCGEGLGRGFDEAGFVCGEEEGEGGKSKRDEQRCFSDVREGASRLLIETTTGTEEKKRMKSREGKSLGRGRRGEGRRTRTFVVGVASGGSRVELRER